MTKDFLTITNEMINSDINFDFDCPTGKCNIFNENLIEEKDSYEKKINPTKMTQEYYLVERFEYTIGSGDGLIKMAKALNKAIEGCNISESDVISHNPNIFHHLSAEEKRDFRNPKYAEKYASLPAGPNDPIKTANIYTFRKVTKKFQIENKEIDYIPFGHGNQQYGAYINITITGGFSGAIKPLIVGFPGVAGLYLGFKGTVKVSAFSYSSKSKKITWPISEGKPDWNVDFIYGLDWVLGDIGGSTNLLTSGDEKTTTASYKVGTSTVKGWKKAASQPDEYSRKKGWSKSKGFSLKPYFETIEGKNGKDTMSCGISAIFSGKIQYVWVYTPGISGELEVSAHGTIQVNAKLFEVDIADQIKNQRVISETKTPLQILPYSIGNFRVDKNSQNPRSRIFETVKVDFPSGTDKLIFTPVN